MAGTSSLGPVGGTIGFVSILTLVFNPIAGLFGLGVAGALDNESGALGTNPGGSSAPGM